MIRIPTNATTHARVHRNSIVAIVPETHGDHFFVKVMLIGPHTFTIKCTDADDQFTLVDDLEKIVESAREDRDH